MKKILAIAWKDTVIRFSSRTEWLFFIVLPVVFTLVINFGVGSAYGSDGDSRIPIFVVDQDGGELARDLIAALDSSETVRVKLTGAAEAERGFKEREAPAILVIPAGLDEAQAAGEAIDLQFTAAAGNTDAVAAQQAVQAALGAVGRSLQAAGIITAAAEEIRPFADDFARQAFYDAAKADAQSRFALRPEWIAVTTAAPAAAEEYAWTPAGQASAGQLITWVFIPLLAISEMFAYERQQGTLRRLVSAPIGKAAALLGTIVGQLATALVQMILIATVGTALFGLPWWREPAATLAMFAAFGLASVAFGTMLGTFVKTQAQAGGISLALGMSMAMLGGCWYPRELFPDIVQKITLALPTTWSMLGMNAILLRGQNLAEVLPVAGVLCGFAAAFFAVGLLRFRYE
ncbi:MAG: ABC transporter permease [Anaerolineales bacterium]|nr:ABC transporter permease [Anaerolineales bacterium]